MIIRAEPLAEPVVNGRRCCVAGLRRVSLSELLLIAQDPQGDYHVLRQVGTSIVAISGPMTHNAAIDAVLPEPAP